MSNLCLKDFTCLLAKSKLLLTKYNRDFKMHYGWLLLRLLRTWGTRLTTPFPPQTSNRLRFRCRATGCSASTCLCKNGYVWLYSTFIWQRLDQWQWFPSLVSILNLPELRVASQLLLEPPIIPTTKRNNTDKKLEFSTGRVFIQCDKSANTKFSILIKYILNSSALSIQIKFSYLRLFGPVNLKYDCRLR